MSGCLLQYNRIYIYIKINYKLAGSPKEFI